MKKILLATSALLGTAFAASAEGTLNLYNWGNYTSPELIEKFTAETGITVTITDYDSNTTALAKVEAGGSGFDLVVPSANYVPIYVGKGLLQELDHSRLVEHRQHRGGVGQCLLGRRAQAYDPMAVGLDRRGGEHGRLLGRREHLRHLSRSAGRT